MATEAGKQDILALTAQIVSAHVSNNTVASDALQSLIRSVYESLVNIEAAPAKEERLEPAVPIRKSVFPDYIVCLEDGKKLKMLKRHLMATYSMTPEQYRQRWNLPESYPMVAPNYAKTRSSLARKIGLGTRRTMPTSAAVESGEPADEEPAPAVAAKSERRTSRPRASA